MSPKKPPTFKPPGSRRAKAARDRQYARPGGRVYNTQRWRRVRAKVLNTGPLCVDCRAAGRVTPATEVDHIVPIADGGAPYALENLRPLCKSCHSKRTAHQVNARER
jgi:5-methylcytosine-specific restriction protein A